MALLRVFQKIEKDVWELTFVNDPEQLSESDKVLMRKQGEPEINLGGTFTGEFGEFTLEDKYAKVRADFPYTAKFDSTAAPFDSNIQDKVQAYLDEIVARFTDAFTTLREFTDTFSGEKTYNI